MNEFCPLTSDPCRSDCAWLYDGRCTMWRIADGLDDVRRALEEEKY